MAMMIVATPPMNHQNIVKAKGVRALAICLLAIMEIAYHEFTSVMEITIVWITAMKTTGTNAVSQKNKIQKDQNNSIV